MELGHQIPRKERALAHGIDVQVNEALDFLLDGRGGAEQIGDRRNDAKRGLGEHSCREAVLGAEVVVEQRLIHAGLGGDFLHTGARCPTADEDPACGIEDAQFGIAISGGPRTCRPPCLLMIHID